MNEQEYQNALRSLPPVKLIQIINKYRKELIFCVEILESVKCLNMKHAKEMIKDLKSVIPEWFDK